MNDQNENPVTRQEMEKLLAARLKSVRPEAWEEDISRNTLDALPFENLPPICEYPLVEIRKHQRVLRLESMLPSGSIEEMIARDQFPIPSAIDRERYNPGFDLEYWLSGLEDFLKVMKVAENFAVEPQTVLDFGCASGRFIRHYVAQSEIPEIWGSDINGRHIRWLYEYLPERVKPIFNHCIPSLPIRDNSVDIITAFSVFTHIDTFETCWLAELSRIMKDDGFCYLTVHNEDTWNLLRNEIDNPENRLIQSILKIDPSVATRIHEPLADERTIYRFSQSGPYRAQVFHSNNFIKKVWGRFFKIEEIIPAHHNRQSVVVLRKS